MADQGAALGTVLLQQRKASGSEVHKGGKHWSDVATFRNVDVFSGDPREWVEFAEKLKSQIAASSLSVATLLDHVETNVAEAELEDHYHPTLLLESDLDEEAATRSAARCTVFC